MPPKWPVSSARSSTSAPNKTTLERVYLITSQSQAEASPAQLLAQNRGHWGIENRLHHVRDMAYDEDRCRARTGHTPPTPSPACGTSLSASCACSTSRTSRRHCGAWPRRPIRSWRCCVCRALKPEDLRPARGPPAAGVRLVLAFLGETLPKKRSPRRFGPPTPSTALASGVQ